jgi:hypothetical protein
VYQTIEVMSEAAVLNLIADYLAQKNLLMTARTLGQEVGTSAQISGSSSLYLPAACD